MEVYEDTSFNSLALAIDTIKDVATKERMLYHREIFGGSLCIGTALEVKKRLPSHIQKFVKLHLPYSIGNREAMHGFLGIWVQNDQEISVIIMDTHSNFGKPFVISNTQDHKTKWNSKPQSEARFYLKDKTIHFQREKTKLEYIESDVTIDCAFELSLTTLAQYPFLAIITYLKQGGPKAYVKLMLEEKNVKFFYQKEGVKEYNFDFESDVDVVWDLPQWINENYAKDLFYPSLERLKEDINIIVKYHHKLLKIREQLKQKFEI